MSDDVLRAAVAWHYTNARAWLWLFRRDRADGAADDAATALQQARKQRHCARVARALLNGTQIPEPSR